MAIDRKEERHDHRHRRDDDPRAMGELRDRHDDEHDPRGDGPDSIDHHASAPTLPAKPVPTTDHSRLRQGEGREHAHHVELDQPSEARVEEPDQGGGQEGQHEHAVREDEAVAAVPELRGHEAIPGQDGGEPGEVLIRGVGGQDQDACSEPLKGEERNRALPEHGLADLSQH